MGTLKVCKKPHEIEASELLYRYNKYELTRPKIMKRVQHLMSAFDNTALHVQRYVVR